MVVYVTTTYGMRGFFSVLVEQDDTGFCEPISTSPFSYETNEEAIQDAISWAKEEEVEYRK